MSDPPTAEQRVRIIAEPPPHFMAKLPIDKKRGFIVPWFVDWVNGEPEFRAMDRRKFMKAINQRLCWVCGNPLYNESVFVIGPMCAVNRISSEPPNHRECAVYSAKVCPFLSRPHMVRRTDDTWEEAKKPSPGVMVERNPGVILLWYTRRYTLLNIKGRAGAGDGILFQLGRAAKLEWYAKGRTATRAEIMESIESGLPTIREAARANDGPAGMERLELEITAAMRLVPRV
jgi:hypothetical protein